MKNIEKTVEKIIKLCNPVSIFLYGSRARNDFLERSDFEIGVLMYSDKYIKRSAIQEKITETNVNVYPFKLEEFINGNLDTPFQKSIYLREIITSSETLYGKDVKELKSPPQISLIDIMQDLRFNIGYSLASVISHRNKDYKTASLEFSKSCLFGSRSLIIHETKSFPLTYDEIYTMTKELDLDIYSDLVSTAYDCRLNNSEYTANDLFTNISYLNNFIETKITDTFNKEGNKILIE